MTSKPRIVFLGTPEFASASLDALHTSGYDITGVVTAPDSPSGRGLKIVPSAVKAYAIHHGIPVLQPHKLKDPLFLDQLRSLDADLQVVVAFRMLPEAVWDMPPLGTFNLHASLLPQYRGAAPINWAIINGEQETGVTTFFLKHEIDTGNILFQEKTAIGDEETAGELHDRLKILGANLVLKTVKAIEQGNIHPVRQEELLQPGIVLKPAPKIYKEDCRIDWSQPAERLFNLIRGLSPFPGAYTMLRPPDGPGVQIKVYRARRAAKDEAATPGSLQTDGKRYLKVACGDGWLDILELQQAGKRRMPVGDFLLGASVNALYIAVSEA